MGFLDDGFQKDVYNLTENLSKPCGYRGGFKFGTHFRFSYMYQKVINELMDLSEII